MYYNHCMKIRCVVLFLNRTCDLVSTYEVMFLMRCLPGADPEGEGGTGGTSPPLGRIGSHNLNFLERWGVGWWGGVTWSLEKVKTKISKLYIIRIKK